MFRVCVFVSFFYGAHFFKALCQLSRSGRSLSSIFSLQCRSKFMPSSMSLSVTSTYSKYVFKINSAATQWCAPGLVSLFWMGPLHKLMSSARLRPHTNLICSGRVSDTELMFSATRTSNCLFPEQFRTHQLRHARLTIYRPE